MRPEHEVFLWWSFVVVNSSGQLGMGPALQRTVAASGGRFTLFACELPSSALSLQFYKSEKKENSGHTAGLMSIEVFGGCLWLTDWEVAAESRPGSCTQRDAVGYKLTAWGYGQRQIKPDSMHFQWERVCLCVLLNVIKYFVSFFNYFLFHRPTSLKCVQNKSPCGR